MRNSKQRELIKNFVIKSYSHPTAEYIYYSLKPDNPNLSLGTVYRNLNNLSEQGIISRVKIAGQSDRFDSITGNHGHIICEKCNKIFDIKTEDFLKHNKKHCDTIGIKIISYNITIAGICFDCQNIDCQKII